MTDSDSHYSQSEITIEYDHTSTDSQEIENDEENFSESNEKSNIFDSSEDDSEESENEESNISDFSYELLEKIDTNEVTCSDNIQEKLESSKYQPKDLESSSEPLIKKEQSTPVQRETIENPFETFLKSTLESLSKGNINKINFEDVCKLVTSNSENSDNPVGFLQKIFKEFEGL